MFCNKCGKEVADGVQFCPACGNAMQNQQSAPNAQQTVVIVQQQTTPPKSRTAYIL